MARTGEPIREITLQELTRKVFNLELFVEKHNHDNTGSQQIPANAIKDGIVSGFLQSQNFVTGASGTGWKFDATGNLEASDGNFRGDITGSTGTFTGSITIGTGNNVVKADGTDGLWVGHALFASAPFRTDLAGNAVMNSLTVNGGIIDGASTLGGRLGSTLAGAIDSSGDLINDIINARLDSSAKTILSDFNFGASDFSGGVKSGDITWNTSTGAITGGSGVVLYRDGIVGAAAGVVTFSIDATTGAATFAGALSAPTGNIGGFTIGSTTLTATNLTLQSGVANTAHIAVGTGSTFAGLNSANVGGDIAIWAGDTHANRASAEFRVTAAGALTATSATITGAITATDLTATTSGNIAGWVISSNELTGGASDIITGGTFRTSSGTERVEMVGADNEIHVVLDSVDRVTLGAGGIIFSAATGGSSGAVLGFGGSKMLFSASGSAGDVDTILTATGVNAGNYSPAAAETADLGTTADRWAKLFLDSDADIDGTLNVAGTGTFQGAVNITGALDVNSTGNFQGSVTFQAALVASSGTVDIGSTSQNFRDAHISVVALVDAITAPGTVGGRAQIYVDSADGDLKVKFADGFVAIIAADS